MEKRKLYIAMKKLKIALFGATGRTGKLFLKKALEKYQINALVRNPAKITIKHDGLELIEGDVLKKEDVSKTLAGADVVVSLVGRVKGSPEDLQTKAMMNIIEVMKTRNMKRLISLTGGGVRDQAMDQPAFMDKMAVFIMKNLAGKTTRQVLRDGINHAEVIKESGLDWTIVRAPMLTEKPAKSKVEIGNVGGVQGFQLTREDLAGFILEEIEKNNYVHQMPFVTNGRR